MKNLRLFLAVTTVASVLITIAAGLTLGPVWATVIGTICVVATIVFSDYVLIKSNQTTLQRLTGVQKQNVRILQSLWSLQQKAEGQRWVLSEQTSQLSAILKQLSEPDESPQAIEDLRRQVERTLRMAEVQQAEAVRKQKMELDRNLEQIFIDDPAVEICRDSQDGEVK